MHGVNNKPVRPMSYIRCWAKTPTNVQTLNILSAKIIMRFNDGVWNLTNTQSCSLDTSLYKYSH